MKHLKVITIVFSILLSLGAVSLIFNKKASSNKDF
ncbi:hypothetical protein SAMN04488530_10933 [Asaccharospora irregularis DSM 2635]|uniref:Uncharacterized protein n=1 Tax=Asaccharospora irregularis DSM 2635 TaxID=1121321 RepID=A0A1M5N7C7_9FIRM|nr:hypothetical protein SAMN04488530_10933 [Asaccharospora irregularis DSM 2635]